MSLGEEFVMTFAGGTRIALVFLALSGCAGCAKSPDAALWECQLSVQKSNAGRSTEDAAERARDIEACMEARNFRLDVRNRACRQGSVSVACYLPR